MDVFVWIDEELKPTECTTDEFIYNDMESQSGCQLPIIYQPFDAGKRAHWLDRGACFDYLATTGGKRLLDFGPGDGWPSLIVAPYVDEVTGVDASPRRIEVCCENARRLEIANANFIRVAPGVPLPFRDGSFDGVMAASSVEQTPDPNKTLAELYRILRPEGRLRIYYEALNQYRGGRERETWLWKISKQICRLILYNRDIERERVRQYALTFTMSDEELIRHFKGDGLSLAFDMVTIPLIESARPALTDVRVCTLIHPSGRTLASWLKEVGFRRVIPTPDGAEIAGQLFDQLAKAKQPEDMNGVDEIVRPAVESAVTEIAPIGDDPMMTAAK
ncbi:MAG: methyltransferase domain-containing protein [Candidatus Zixiibacteriota bacterium]|nr:MAG: methyltransferase domain-containing protein [candidate division Zixibacteria bacterium]